MIANPWRHEWLKLFAALACTLLIYQLFGWWWLAILLAMGAYSGFMLFKIYRIHQWLKGGLQEEKIPSVGGVLGHLVTLIYRHKKATDAAHEEQKMQAQQFFETLSAIPSATIILNKNNEIEWANYPALLLLGVNGQRDIGIKIDHLLRQKALLAHLNSNTNEQFEITAPASQNVTLAVQIVKYAQRRRLLLAHNITPHIEVQQSRKTFVANASHELRTPLTVVAGYLEFAQSDPSLPEALQHPIEKAIEQTGNMEMLINDLLVLSKLEDKELRDKHVSTIDVSKHLETILQTLETSGKTKNHRIIKKKATTMGAKGSESVLPESLLIEASEKELNSVCYNLINNAVKYSEPGSDITVKWEKLSSDYVKFSVTDQGLGIAPQHIAHLTERFYRVDTGRSKRVGGTGLGLSIVKHILERHNGRLEIHSQVGEGSTFSAVFPFHPLKHTSPKDRKIFY